MMISESKLKEIEQKAFEKYPIIMRKVLYETGLCYNEDINEDSRNAYIEGCKDILKSFPKWRKIKNVTTKRTDENDCITTEPVFIKGWIDDNDYRIINSNVMVNRNIYCIPVKELSKIYNEC